MKTTIIANDLEHLKKLLKKETELNGWECDLNHIDVSNVDDMSYLFHYSLFNGDISKWDVSNVNDMSHMFSNSKFNKDISKWNVSNVTSMYNMFYSAKFRGEISKWDVSKVENMNYMCQFSKFDGDLSDWTPYSLNEVKEIFKQCKVLAPYWSKFENKENRNNAIHKYCLNKELKESLLNNQIPVKKPKI